MAESNLLRTSRKPISSAADRSASFQRISANSLRGYLIAA
jgi:hypothetical protein